MPMTTFAGDTGSPLYFTLKTINPLTGATQALNCSGFTNANFVLHLYPGSGSPIVCAGNWTVIDGPNGIVMYQPLSSEISTAATYTIYLQAILANGPKTFQTDTLTISPVH